MKNIEDELRDIHAKIDALRAEIRAAGIQTKPEWLSPDEYADRLLVSRSTIMKRVQSGEYETRGSGSKMMIKAKS